MGVDLQINAGIGDYVILAGGLSAVSEKFEGIQLATDSNTTTVVKDTSWDASDLQLGVWLEGIVNIGKFTPVLAARLDNSSSYGMFISPQAGLAYDIIPHMLNVSAAYGQSFRAPTFNDLYWPANAFTGGDSTLVPEQGQSAAFTITFNPAYFLNFSLAGSWKEIDNMISWNPDSAGFWKPFNVDQVTILGGEFSAGWDILEGLLTGSLGLSCNHAIETREILTYSGYDEFWNPVIRKEQVTRQAAFVAPLAINANIAVRAWLGGKISTSLSWTGQRINYYPDWSTAPDIGVIEKTIEPAFKLEASVSQKFFNILTVEAGVRNILNDQTSAHFGGATDLDYPTAPRRFYGAVSVDY
jgi:outer membrane receptor protein involved in Fe transport